jgi:DNA-binding CsgD family transcriptional regulator
VGAKESRRQVAFKNYGLVAPVFENLGPGFRVTVLSASKAEYIHVSENSDDTENVVKNQAATENDMVNVVEKLVKSDFDKKDVVENDVVTKKGAGTVAENQAAIENDTLNVVEKLVKRDFDKKDVVENDVAAKKGAGSVVEKEAAIKAMMAANPQISAQKIAGQLNITVRTVQRIMSKMQLNNIIRRIGPDKGGRWELL